MSLCAGRFLILELVSQHHATWLSHHAWLRAGCFLTLELAVPALLLLGQASCKRRLLETVERHGLNTLPICAGAQKDLGCCTEQSWKLEFPAPPVRLTELPPTAPCSRTVASTSIQWGIACMCIQDALF